ncbi:putative membrane protein [Microbacterium sp. AK009]|uniref:hypothetical protein n=1 Tax=Microbacterium sp. AK009 TaxID=2723068 RepID=UPI0015CD7778|nr:hypothetical protein [Microbacterium sp. AK009]NYF16700.1 putative membrane protein [Microbacterium sp. AK009]
MTSSSAESVAPAVPTTRVRVESEAFYAFVAAAASGGVLGLLLGWFGPPRPLSGEGSFGWISAAACAVTAVSAAGVGYWRARRSPGHRWRLVLSSWRFGVNAVAVALVHAGLATLAALVVFLVLNAGLIGWDVEPFWAAVLMGATTGITAYLVYLSASGMTTRRMSSLLLAFVVVGTLTAMVTTPDPAWWEIHFSHLGTFRHLSSVVFNGTLILGGLLVTAFAVYVAHDLAAAAASGGIDPAARWRVVPTLFVVMGIMLAGVGAVPVNASLLIHNLCASGLAAMFLCLLAGGRWLMRGLPRAYFRAAALFLIALLVSVVLFATGYFGLTAFEIVVFALIFGWIAVFIRFLTADQPADTGDAAEAGPTHGIRLPDASVRGVLPE